MRTSEDKVCRKDLCWSVRAAYILDKLPDVRGPGLREAGRYIMVSRDSPTRTLVSVRGRDVTPRPTNSIGEFENLSDEAEELCYSSLFRIYVTPIWS